MIRLRARARQRPPSRPLGLHRFPLHDMPPKALYLRQPLTSQADHVPQTTPDTADRQHRESSTAQLLRRFWRDYLKKHLWWIVVAFVLMSVEGGALGVLSYMLEPLFDRVFVGREAGAVWWVGGIILSLFVVRAITLILNRSILIRVSMQSSTEMQVDLLRHMLRLDSSFFKDNPPGALIERVQGDTLAIQKVWQTLVTSVGRDMIALVALTVVAVGVAPKWALMAVIGVPLLVLPGAMAQRYIRRKTKSMRVTSSDRATRLDEIFHGIDAVKLNRMEDYQIGRFRTLVDRIVQSEIKVAAIRATIPAMIDLMTGVGFFLVLVIGGQDILSGEKTVGQFMAFFTAMSLAFQPLRRLGATAGILQVSAASLQRIYNYMDTDPVIRNPATPIALAADVRPDLSIESVHFAFGDKPVLNGLDLSADAGQMVALVGPSGAGKTTVFGLLTRLIDPSKGTIAVGGTPISDLALDDLRGLFSVVSQDALLFDETIRDNILMGRTEVSEDRLQQVLKAAHVSDFLPQLPNGLDSRAGPRGSSLSGGQRQRVAIARALLSDAPILLMDEATSALDAKSEKIVQTALSELRHGRTTIVIAHRLATVREADKIVFMDQGRVIEQGTHEELVANDGPYSMLYKLQFATEGA